MPKEDSDIKTVLELVWIILHFFTVSSSWIMQELFLTLTLKCMMSDDTLENIGKHLDILGVLCNILWEPK